MILGLNGLKGSGKDTVAAYLIKEHGFERRAFADPLKKSVAALLDIPFHKIDEYKNNPHIYISVVNEVLGNEEGESRLIESFNFREFLQRYGTESHRDVFGYNFWLNYTLPNDAYYVGRKIAITDLRFENEAVRVHACGGFVVNIVRSGLSMTDVHESEQPLPPNKIDYSLMNSDTLEVFEGQIELMLEELGTAAWKGTSNG